tara:strand:- start:10220 stop:12781 length:2562 start_codon:yes stop_codon:yes gene_type:complete
MNISLKFFYLGVFISILISEPFSEYKDNKSYILENLDSEITLDGKLDDMAWKNIKEFSDFMSTNYSLNQIPSKKSSVKIACDENNIYVGVELFDDPGKITFKKGAYDDFVETFDLNSDYFIIEIDSDHNHKSSYGFAVNSSNVKADYLIYDDEFIDDNWNSDWDSMVFIGDNSWSIEYKIPTSIFRYPNEKNMTWGLNLIRYVKRNNEYMAWIVLPEEKKGIVSQYGHIENVSFTQKSTVQIRPYLSSSRYKYDDDFYPYLYDNFGNIEGLDFSQNALDNYNANGKNNNIGLDINFNPNSFSKINLTFKPDFGQINQDASEVNNTAYETYFDEKRSFFIDNALLFSTPINVFYSRRIGDYIKYNYNNQPFQFQSDLNTAFKYTSKINNYSYGFLIAYTEPQNQNLIDNDIKSSVFKINKSFLNNDLTIGLIGTDFNHKHIKSNVYGLDYTFNLINSKLNINGQTIQSNNHSSKGNGVTLNLNYRSDVFSVFNKNELFLDFWFNINQYDKNLDIDDLGYLFRNNLKENSTGFSINNYKSLNKSKYIFQYYKAENYSKNTISNIISFNYNLILNELITFEIGVSQEGDHYNDKFYDDYYNLDLNKIIKTPNDAVLNFKYNDYRSDIFSYSINLNKFKNNIDDKGNSILIDLEFKPLAWIDVNFTYDRLDYYETYHFLKIRQLPSGINVLNNYYQNSHRDSYSYLFINSNNLELYYTTQVSAYFSDNLSFQLYGEYFVHEDKWGQNSSLYEIQQTDDDFVYPNLISGLSSELINFDTDKIKYSSLYNSVMFNFVTKWNFNKSSSIYFVYSLSKGVNGKIFNNFMDLIKFNNSSNLYGSYPEVFYHHSGSIKVELYF